MVQKILVVDDNEDDLKSIVCFLTEEGYSVDETQNGKNALDMARHKKYDLILLDILMPVCSGYDLKKLLKKEVDEKLKIVYISIVSEKEVDLGEVEGFIQKPFSKQSLLEPIKIFLQN